jgi:hypothetical protein
MGYRATSLWLRVLMTSEPGAIFALRAGGRERR